MHEKALLLLAVNLILLQVGKEAGVMIWILTDEEESMGIRGPLPGYLVL